MRREPLSPKELPAGVRLRQLSPHRDERGTFTEVFRQEWGVGMAPVQWNVVHTERDVLRGVHVHVFHDDYVVLVAGSASIGLADLRQSSATFGARAVVPMSASAIAGLVIPPGVAHGFLFHEPSVHLYAVTHYWSPADELGWPLGRSRACDPVAFAPDPRLQEGPGASEPDRAPSTARGGRRRVDRCSPRVGQRGAARLSDGVAPSEAERAASAPRKARAIPASGPGAAVGPRPFPSCSGT